MPVLDNTPKLFGAYVVDVNTTLSWGSQGTASSITIVEDPHPDDPDKHVVADIPDMGSPVMFPDKQFIPNPDFDDTIPADPDTNPEEILFSFGPFDFNKPLVSGLLQRVSYNESLSGRTYTVTVASAASIFDGIQIILSKFNGYGLGGLITNEIPNLYNVYGYYENYIWGMPSNPVFNGSKGAGFGNSAADELGFPIRAINEIGGEVKLLPTIEYLVNKHEGTDPQDPDRKPPVHGDALITTQFDQRIKSAFSEFKIDLSELQVALDSRNLGYYRVSGTVRDLSGILSELCDLIQHDWLVDLVQEENQRGEEDADGNLILDNILKLRLMDRSSQPVPGVIETLVENGKATGELISAETGKELSKSTTSKLVIGGPVSRYFDIPLLPTVDRPAGQNTLPMWGKFGNFYQVHSKPGFGYLFSESVYTRDNLINKEYNFPITVFVDGVGTPYNATLMEMRILTGEGADKTWPLFKVMQVLSNNEPNGVQITDLPDMPWFSKVQVDKDVLQRLANFQLSMQSTTMTRLKQHKNRQNEKKQREFDQWFSSLRSMANESFCRQFMVRSGMDMREVFDASLNNQAYKYTGIDDQGNFIKEPIIMSPQDFTDENIRYINTFGDLSAEQFKLSWEIVDDAWAVNPRVGRAEFFNNGRLKAVVAFSKSVGIGEWGGDYLGKPNAAVKEVFVDEMGSDWFYTNPFQGGGNTQGPANPYAPNRLLNSVTANWQNIGINPQATGLYGDGSAYVPTVLSATPKILSLDGGPIELSQYKLDLTRKHPITGVDFTYPSMVVPCVTTVNPLVLDEFSTPYFGLAVLAKYFFDVDMDLRIFNRPNNSHMIYEIPPLRTLPLGFGLPQQSNRYQYGPFFITAGNNSLVTGKTAVEFDDNLKPETYGGYPGMEQSGHAQASIDIGRVGPEETGTVKFAGVPSVRLGDRMVDGGPYVTDLSISVSTGEVTTSYKFQTWTPTFGKIAKYNIDLLARLGKSSFKNTLVTGAGPPLGVMIGKPKSFQEYRKDYNARFGDKNTKNMLTMTLDTVLSDDEALEAAQNIPDEYKIPDFKSESASTTAASTAASDDTSSSTASNTISAAADTTDSTTSTDTSSSSSASSSSSGGGYY